jgi:type III restriction enzyme
MSQTTLVGKNWLSDELLMKLGEYNINNIPVPKEISENLTPKFPIRGYQTKAFQRFIAYLERYEERQVPQSVLFNMATGSGKTLIMAGLIPYLYNKGYRNFLFFVNSNNIINKTIDNFLNKSSTKYLFNDKIIINNKLVEINQVNNFDDSNSESINICFTTIQKLHSDLSIDKENSLTFEDFKDKKLVLIADEAHHIQSRTKQKTLSEKPTWENTIEKILSKNTQNILLEFTATMGFVNNSSIKEKYMDRLLYKYALPQFRNDRYSKDIDLFRVDGDKKYRMLVATLINQYRQDIGSKYGLNNFKPVILFKAQKEIKESLENHKLFRELIDNLKTKDLRKIKEKGSKLTIIPKIFNFYKLENITLNQLVKKLHLNFNEKFCLNVNEESLDKKSISKTNKNEVLIQENILNSLENKNNPIRVIFAVHKLNEGWDVLNLFDIVRVSGKQASGGGYKGKLSKSTISEAQLIGRGARYYPFVISNDQEKYKRKFDENITHELRILEELYFHSWNDSRYIADIKNAIREKLGLDLDNVEEKELKLKESFKKTKLYQHGKIYMNKKIKKDYSKMKSFEDMGFNKRNIRFEIFSGKSEKTHAFSDEHYDNSRIIKKTRTLRISEFEPHIIRNALSKISFFEFKNIQEIFPSLESTNEFITKKYFLKELSIEFVGTESDLENLTNKQKLNGILKLLNYIKDVLNKNRVTYIGSTEFSPKSISDIFKDTKLKLNKTDPRSEGMELHLKYKDWYAFNANYGTSEEKACVDFIETIIEEHLKEDFEEIYLLRNERHFTLHDFEQGRGFQPDFVLFMNSKKGKTINYQLFIEPKGKHIEDKDRWKEEFLLQIEEKFKKQGLKKFIETKNYRIIGLPFYNQLTPNEFKDSMLEKL